MIKSLHARQHTLAQQEKQLELLEAGSHPSFNEKLNTVGFGPLRPSHIEIFQVNVGYMCNQVCKHCHVDAGPDRKEIMTRDTMQVCLDVLKKSNIKTLDITGGAPELNPDFRWFVKEASKSGVAEIIVRSNLTIILSNPKYHDLPEFFKEHHVRVASSLPFYDAGKTDRQRGDGQQLFSLMLIPSQCQEFEHFARFLHDKIGRKLDPCHFQEYLAHHLLLEPR
jgi:sulfatase maturation enzyme AslB (radical SAM superfamily)